MPNNSQHQRITEILFHHWNQARGERLFPAREAINESALQQNGVWDDIFILDILPLTDSNKYHFSYTGKNLNKDFKKDSGGNFIKNLVTGLLNNSNDKYNIVAEQKKPIQQEEVYKSPQTGIIIKYRQILLPLGPNDDEPINAIIGGMRHIQE